MRFEDGASSRWPMLVKFLSLHDQYTGSRYNRHWLESEEHLNAMRLTNVQFLRTVQYCPKEPKDL